MATLEEQQLEEAVARAKAKISNLTHELADLEPRRREIEAKFDQCEAALSKVPWRHHEQCSEEFMEIWEQHKALARSHDWHECWRLDAAYASACKEHRALFERLSKIRKKRSGGSGEWACRRAAAVGACSLTALPFPAGKAAGSNPESQGLIAASYSSQESDGGALGGLWGGVQQVAAKLRGVFGSQPAGDEDYPAAGRRKHI